MMLRSITTALLLALSTPLFAEQDIRAGDITTNFMWNNSTQSYSDSNTKFDTGLLQTGGLYFLADFLAAGASLTVASFSDGDRSQSIVGLAPEARLYLPIAMVNPFLSVSYSVSANSRSIKSDPSYDPGVDTRSGTVIKFGGDIFVNKHIAFEPFFYVSKQTEKNSNANGQSSSFTDTGLQVAFALFFN